MPQDELFPAQAEPRIAAGASAANTASCSRPLVASPSPASMAVRPFQSLKRPPRLGHHHRGGGGIPGVEQRVDHDVGPAGCYQQIAIAVTPGADDAAGILKFQPDFAPGSVCVEHSWPPPKITEVTGADQAVSQVTPTGDPGRRWLLVTPLVPGAAAVGCVDQFVEGRHKDDTQYPNALAATADESGVEGHAADERFGAVNRIDDPFEARTARPAAGLLSQEGVVGKRPEQPPAENLFGCNVGGCHRRGIGLGPDSKLRVLKPIERSAARFAGGRQRDL